MSIRNLLGVSGPSGPVQPSERPWARLVVSDIQTSTINVIDGFTGTSVYDNLEVNHAISVFGDPSGLPGSYYGFTTEPNKLVYGVQGVNNSHYFINGGGPTGLFQINGNGVIATNPDSATSNILDDGSGRIICHSELQVKGAGTLTLGTSPDACIFLSETFTTPLVYTIYNSSSNCDLQLGISNIVNINSATVMTIQDSGRLIYLDNISTDYVITLPARLSGFKCTFLISNPLAGNITIQTPVLLTLVANVYGVINPNLGNTAISSITIANSGGGSNIGDRYELLCDGSRYYFVCHVYDSNSVAVNI